MREIGIFTTFYTLLVVFIYSVQTSDRKMPNYPEFNNIEDVKAISESQNRFTKDLYIALSKNSEGNVFFSPFSIATALAMVNIGSRGNTDTQMQSVLHLPQDKSSIRRAFHELISDFKKDVEDYELKTSNMAYISDKLSVIDSFTSALSDDFLTSCKQANFDLSDKVREEINQAVEKETGSKIKDLIPSGILTAMTRMVLVNAIYFKGLWLHPFSPTDTRPQPFWVTTDRSIQVQMMTVEKDFRIAPKPELDATLLALDYKGGRLSFIILLPNEKEGLGTLEEKIASLDLAALDTKTATSRTQVFLPKFKLEEQIDLVPVLSEMGIQDLFSENSCDLSGISGKKDLFVSNVIHKAFLDITEEGSEAAAATESVVRLKRSLDVVHTYVVDRPFVFLIYDKRSQLTLFMGRLSAPTEYLALRKEEL